MDKWKGRHSNLSPGSSGGARRCAGKGTVMRELGETSSTKDMSHAIIKKYKCVVVRK